VLVAALRLGLAGAHRLETLRLTCVAATDLETGRVLADRILAPLRARGAYGGDLRRTVVAFQASGLRVADTATALHVHPNTIRHRLANFAGLTGVNLRDPADLAEIWWLTVTTASDLEQRL
jgi:DNA-binding PucR family transcriptional regulator